MKWTARSAAYIAPEDPKKPTRMCIPLQELGAIDGKIKSGGGMVQQVIVKRTVYELDVFWSKESKGLA